MKTPLDRNDLFNQVLKGIKNIDLGRSVLFFDEDNYFVTLGINKDDFLTKQQKVELGIISPEESEEYDNEKKDDLVVLVSGITTFLDKYPEMYIDDILNSKVMDK